jgi:tyrosine decarboxylase/aspartate 1-decarboxylase
MQLKGKPSSEVYAELKNRQLLNNHYKDGRILCSMCTDPHPIAMKAYQLFSDSNLGDQALFPATTQLEREVISQLSTLLHGTGNPGFIVSGGTEANLLALLSARNKANIPNPEVILAESAHFSFTKICNLLNITPIYAPLDNLFKIKISEVKRLVNKNTVAIVGTAGTAELGTVDSISELSEISQCHNLHLHIDAAFGGLVIPFLKEPFEFDFKLEGVKSITIDPHKMGMAAIPAGGILFRSKKSLDYLETETPYLSNKNQFTFVGTRTGASVASAWAVFKTLGIEGYQKTVNSCIRNTQFLVEGLQKSGFSLLCPPTLNIVAFKAENTKELAEKLRQRGWFISYIPRYDCIRLVIMPHVKIKHLASLLCDLKT